MSKLWLSSATLVVLSMFFVSLRTIYTALCFLTLRKHCVIKSFQIFMERQEIPIGIFLADLIDTWRMSKPITIFYAKEQLSQTAKKTLFEKYRRFNVPSYTLHFLRLKSTLFNSTPAFPHKTTLVLISLLQSPFFVYILHMYKLKCSTSSLVLLPFQTFI